MPDVNCIINEYEGYKSGLIKQVLNMKTNILRACWSTLSFLIHWIFLCRAHTSAVGCFCMLCAVPTHSFVGMGVILSLFDALKKKNDVMKWSRLNSIINYTKFWQGHIFFACFMTILGAFEPTYSTKLHGWKSENSNVHNINHLNTCTIKVAYVRGAILKR